MRTIVLLSGPIAAGKTTLCDDLVNRYGFRMFKTRELIEALRSVPAERAALQKAGEALDVKTNGAWVAEALAKKVQDLQDEESIVVDSVRIKQQIDGVRKAFGASVVHIHLTADPDILERRYLKRLKRARIQELTPYSDLKQDRTERGVGSLSNYADVVIDAGRCTEQDVSVRVASRLGLYGRRVQRLVDVVIGGEYGSEGKGHIASFLAPEYDYLLRVGGPNAGHSIYEEPKAYVHHQLPSGTRKCEATLIIGPGAVISVPKLLKEISECRVSVDRLFIDPCAMLIEQADIDFEERTLRGDIGSTAQGVGSATSRKILRTAANPKVRLAKADKDLKPYLKETLRVLDDAFAQGKRVFVEGRRVQEIGTASLRNYLLLAYEWFKVDLSQYNFFLMPISFFHGFEAAEPVTRADYPVQVQKLLTYLDAREAADTGDAGEQRVTLHIETKLVRGKDAAAVEFRYTDNPNAPAIAIRQEDILKNFPFSYELLTTALNGRYSDFIVNAKYHKIRRALDSEKKFCHRHPLNPTKLEGACQRFYNSNIFQEFDKHYTRRKK